MKKSTPNLMSMLHQLIAIPSMSSVNPSFDTSNRAVIDLLACWYEALGFTVQVMPLPRQPHKANLIATIGPAQEHGKNQGIMLAGHTDTVPCEEKFWRFHPFRLTEQENRLYGLGTTDMKSFFALIIEAFKRFDASRFKQPLVVLATADEESSMEGAAMLIQETSLPVRSAVIGEPTGLKPVNAHKGMIMNGIRLIGRGGHSSNPALGLNAMEFMHQVLGELICWRDDLQRRYQDNRFAVPVPTLNLGHIQGGDNPNRICDQCEVHFDIRLLPGMDVQSLHDELHTRLKTLLAGTEIDWEFFPLKQGTPPMLTAKDSRIVKSCELYSHAAAHAVAFCTEGPYLTKLGIDTVILGPGNIAQAHQPDEYLELSSIQPCVDILAKLIAEHCL
ncbi:MAG: acetylornithine deacetylase [Burkholderiales bacterium]|uniref:acetylornithine deacetylase n=1 Tax=Nitrosomonas sp. TaxID=42353 RepID=UPI001DCF0E76|nr:acetylornithine deacetylase [Nitrosomonas sp.]MCB1948153.1 acetylornithine deacetylase [Nitrosomonas sp.]MCP5243134.1 acetylornithine deacetylase [Burkholderiales bacterium]